MQNEISPEALVPFGFYPEMRASHRRPITVKEERITFTGEFGSYNSKFFRFYSGNNLLMRVAAERSDCETLEIIDPTLRNRFLSMLERSEMKEHLRRERKVVNVYPNLYFQGVPTWQYNLKVFLIALPFIIWPFFLLYLL